MYTKYISSSWKIGNASRNQKEKKDSQRNHTKEKKSKTKIGIFVFSFNIKFYLFDNLINQVISKQICKLVCRFYDFPHRQYHNLEELQAKPKAI